MPLPPTRARGALRLCPSRCGARQPGFRDAALAQLRRLFGAEAAKTGEVIVKHCSADPATATIADQTPPAGHPSYRALPLSERLIFAWSEAASEDGGFLEGSLAAAEAALARVNAVLR